MKRSFLMNFVAAATMILAGSCQKDQERTLSLIIEPYDEGDKAYINDNYYACWSDGDAMMLNGISRSVNIVGDQAVIQVPSGMGGDITAYYPGDGISYDMTITLPQIQTYEVITDAQGVSRQKVRNPMAAFCPSNSEELRFRNLCALLKVTVVAQDGDLHIDSIRVKGNDGQMLWGTAQLETNIQNLPILYHLTGGGSSVRLVFPTPDTIVAANTKSYYVIVPGGSNFDDLSLTIYTADGHAYYKSSRIGQTLPRNHIGALSYTATALDKCYSIAYSGSISGFHSDRFGEANVLKNEDGTLLFDAPVTTIGTDAFNNCRDLKSIVLPKTLTTIGSSAFKDCRNLKSVTFPASLTSIRENAFDYCTSLQTINLSGTAVTSIGSMAFYHCEALTNINFPSTLASLGGSALYYCYYLRSVDLSGTSLQVIESNTFRMCNYLQEVRLPNTLTSIGLGAFEDDGNLNTIDIPATVTSIGEKAFRYCNHLNKINSRPTTPPSLGDDAFFNINSYCRLHVPAGYATAYEGWGGFSSPYIIDDL